MFTVALALYISFTLPLSLPPIHSLFLSIPVTAFLLHSSSLSALSSSTPLINFPHTHTLLPTPCLSSTYSASPSYSISFPVLSLHPTHILPYTHFSLSSYRSTFSLSLSLSVSLIILLLSHSHFPPLLIFTFPFPFHSLLLHQTLCTFHCSSFQFFPPDSFL